MSVVSFEGEKIAKIAQAEISAIGEIIALLEPLEHSSKLRVLQYVTSYVARNSRQTTEG